MPFNKQPSISGKLISLRPLVGDDFPQLFAVAADPLLWAQHPANNRYEEDVFRDFFADAIASGGALLVTDIETGEVIGSSRFHAHSEKDRSVEIGWTFLARAYWGGIYNAELKDLMLTHAFDNVDKVFFLIAPENFRSQMATKKIGGVHVGSRTSEALVTNFVFELKRDFFQRNY